WETVTATVTGPPAWPSPARPAGLPGRGRAVSPRPGRRSGRRGPAWRSGSPARHPRSPATAAPRRDPGASGGAVATADGGGRRPAGAREYGKASALRLRVATEQGKCRWRRARAGGVVSADLTGSTPRREDKE